MIDHCTKKWGAVGVVVVVVVVVVVRDRYRQREPNEYKAVPPLPSGQIFP